MLGCSNPTYRSASRPARGPKGSTPPLPGPCLFQRFFYVTPICVSSVDFYTPAKTCWALLMSSIVVQSSAPALPRRLLVFLQDSWGRVCTEVCRQPAATARSPPSWSWTSLPTAQSSFPWLGTSGDRSRPSAPDLSWTAPRWWCTWRLPAALVVF